ncbi:hypothetical protein FDECE_18061 [Fusarium decemcellulare]|nr:hypothetical protein FDECE_18061 [Fusarium decemcellulare]
MSLLLLITFPFHCKESAGHPGTSKIHPPRRVLFSFLLILVISLEPSLERAPFTLLDPSTLNRYHFASAHFSLPAMELSMLSSAYFDKTSFSPSKQAPDPDIPLRSIPRLSTRKRPTAGSRAIIALSDDEDEKILPPTKKRGTSGVTRNSNALTSAGFSISIATAGRPLPVWAKLAGGGTMPQDLAAVYKASSEEFYEVVEEAFSKLSTKQRSSGFGKIRCFRAYSMLFPKRNLPTVSRLQSICPGSSPEPSTIGYHLSSAL